MLPKRNSSAVHPNSTTLAIEVAWNNGHFMRAFEPDTEDSIVADCIFCGAVAAVDGQEIAGDALTTECRRAAE